MKISAVIPVHNREALVGRAIASVMAQTLPVDELVVVDDASTDRTVDIVKEFTKGFNALTLLSLKENVGGAAARNAGIKASRGDLIAFLDSDDIWYPSKLLKQVREFEANANLVATCCGILMRSEEGPSHRRIPPAIITPSVLYHSCAIVTMSAALICKRALERIGGFETSLPACQDWDLFVRLSECGEISVVQEELVEFWRHSGPRISRNMASVLSGHRAVYEKIYGRISNPLERRNARASHELRLAEIFSTDFFEPSRAIGHACKGLVLFPSRGHLAYFQYIIQSLVKSYRSSLKTDLLPR